MVSLFIVIRIIYKYKNSKKYVWEIAVHLAVACEVFIDVSLCCPFFPRDVLDENLDLIGPVSEGFPTFF